MSAADDDFKLDQGSSPEQRKALEDLRLEQLEAEHSCDHGAMERRAGVSWQGKPWAGYFCKASSKGCPPAWADLAEILMPALNAWAARGRTRGCPGSDNRLTSKSHTAQSKDHDNRLIGVGGHPENPIRDTRT